MMGNCTHTHTLGHTQSECWCNGGFEAVADVEGAEWRSKYWRRMDASIASAKRKGWQMVRVEIVEKVK